MIRLYDIIDALSPLVGWEQDYNPNKKIDERLTESESGLYYQGAHPLLTLENMRAVIPDDLEATYKNWNADDYFLTNTRVHHDNKVWLCLRTNRGHIPEVGSEFWAISSATSDFITKLTENGIKNVVTRFIRDKVIGMETRNIIEKRTLFDGAGRIADTIPNRDRVVGFEITPLRQGGITMKLEKVGLQFKGNTGKVTLYLFHSSQPDPVWEQEFEIESDNGTFKWFDLPTDMYLPYLNSYTNAGGSWYFVYHQGTLPDYMEAVNFARDWSREPCATCNKGDVQLYREMTKYVRISPFCVDIDPNSDTMMWDISRNIYTNTLNYGMNLQFSIGCDLTDTIIAQKSIFADVIQKQVAHDCLRTIALNPNVRVNRNQANVGRDNILYELDGNGQGVKGLKGDLEKAYKALSIDTKGLDPVCLGCHTGGIRIRAI